METRLRAALVPLLLSLLFMGLLSSTTRAQSNDQVVQADTNADGTYENVTFKDLRKNYTTQGVYDDGSHTGWTWEEGTGYDIVVYDAAGGKVWKFNGLNNHLNQAGTISEWNGSAWQNVGNWKL